MNLIRIGQSKYKKLENKMSWKIKGESVIFSTSGIVQDNLLIHLDATNSFPIVVLDQLGLI